MTEIIRAHGFTNESLEWQAWHTLITIAESLVFSQWDS